MRLAANLSMLFTDAPFLERVGRAARAGFRAVECQFPYEYDATALREQLDLHHLELVLHNLPAGDWAAGDRGMACDPARMDEFAIGLERAIAWAQALGCTRLNCLAGAVPAGMTREVARDTLVRNLDMAAWRLKGEGIRLLLEAINTRDVPGFLVHTTRDAREVLDAVGSDNLFIQYDAYHMQIMEGDLSRTIEANLDCIAHIQIADPPLRSEPGTGEINVPYLFDFLDRVGYDGWVGCEYTPLGRTEDGLAWARPYLQR